MYGSCCHSRTWSDHSNLEEQPQETSQHLRRLAAISISRSSLSSCNVRLTSTMSAPADFPKLKIVSPSDVKGMVFDPVDPTARLQAAAILKEVKDNGLAGLVACALRLGDIQSADAKLFYDKTERNAISKQHIRCS